MDRSNWLRQKRRDSEALLDSLAPIYDNNWGSIDTTHQLFIERFLSLCPPESTILDAACGTGKYWNMILTSGRAVFGIDHSEGMLARAKAKFPDIPTEKVGLEELHYHQAFDGAICMDAMECVFPEDWTLVLSNLYRAIKPKRYSYFTVELAEEKDIENAFATGQQLGLPIVYGEWAPEGRYHYYPKIEQVREWIQRARFRLIDETVGDDYHHFLVQKN